MSQSFFFNQTVLIVIAALIAAAAVVYAFVRRDKALRKKLDALFGKMPVRTDKLDMKSISAYWRARCNNEDIPHPIDAVTWDDLDMDKVFDRLNTCHTSAGEEYLYALLYEPAFHHDILAQRESLYALLEQDPKLRLDLQVYLYKTGKKDHNGLTSFIYDPSSKRLKHAFIYNLLAFIPFVCIGIMFRNVSVGILALAISLIGNIAVHCLTKTYIEKEIESLGYISSLLWCAKKISREEALSGHPLLTCLGEHIGNLRKIAGKLSSVAKQNMNDVDMLIEYIKIPFLTDIRNYNRSIQVITNNADSLHSLYRIIGELDAAIAVLSFRKSIPHFTQPDFLADAKIDTADIYHPLLTDPVPNTAMIDRSSLVSGSNASGKSTFIKALAINGIFAQTINTCTAKSYRTRFALVMTSMAVRDDISAGESYFITELKSLRRIIQKIPSVFCICFIDEILKGTNTVERIAASASVLKYLQQRDCLCLAATHDIELTRMLDRQYNNFHFSEQITDSGMTFDYTLKKGASRTKNAIRLLDYMDFDPGIISRAQNLVAKFEQTQTWETLD